MSRSQRLEIIPLGGLGEFGMNMMVYRLGDDCILVDAGMMFPGTDHLGVDVIIPDLDFLDDCGTLHAVVLTHGHEDHIGAVPFVLARHDVPLVLAPYTARLVKKRLREHDLDGAPEMRDLPGHGESIELGPFTIRTIQVAHSIPHSAMLVIGTPLGNVVHTADFKIDAHPPDGAGTDLSKLAEIGREGVLALLSDSTNAERPGVTPSERVVGPALDRVLATAAARVFVTTFSSNVQRMQQVVDAAHRAGRRVGIVGTSMRAHSEIAQDLGLLHFPPGVHREPEDCMSMPRDRVVFMTTGSQGEPRSALTRIALDKHRDVHVEPDDLVVHSARVIPGNERSINRLVNHLLRRGARIVMADDESVHVSGHPSQDELRIVLDLLRPRYLVPIHGEYRQLVAHADIGYDAGLDDDRIAVIDSGDVLAIDRNDCEVVDRVHVGKVFIDNALDPVDVEVLRDRKQLAGEGTVIAVVAVDRDSGRMTRPPELVARGFVPEFEEGDAWLEDAVDWLETGLADSTSEERADEGVLKARIHTELKRYFKRRLQRRPMIVPVVVEH